MVLQGMIVVTLVGHSVFDLFCVKGFVRILLECRCVLESASFDTLASHDFGECWGKADYVYS